MMLNRDGSARLVLIRHGETVGNQQRLWTGWTDTALSGVGQEQVRRTTDRLERDSMGAVALYASPTGRAWRTAHSIGCAVNLRPIEDEALREMHFGDLESIREDHFASDHPDVYARWRDWDDETFCWPGGESRRDFRARTVSAVRRIADAHRGQTVLLVTHSGYIRMALAHFVPEHYGDWRRVRPDNCGLTELLVDSEGRAEVPVFNDVSHLSAIDVHSSLQLDRSPARHG